MKDLSIDLETYSDIDIKKAGLYRYIESEHFEILLFAYSVDFGEVQVVDFTAGETLPKEIADALSDKNVVKHAFNATFEITCLLRTGYKTDISQWMCTKIYGLYLGYPASLDKLGNALRLPEDKAKLRIGQALIRFFCKPDKNGKRNFPEHEAPAETKSDEERQDKQKRFEKWLLFKEYNQQDVVAEMEIYKILSEISVPKEVWEDWALDYEINKRGIKLDRKLIEGALTLDEEYKEELTDRAKEITKLTNPNSRAQLLGWLRTRHGYEDLPDLTKATVEERINSVEPEDDQDAAEVLRLRQKLAKSSIAKYTTMEIVISPNDDRARGLLQFYGSHTGRWCGRLIQCQNLPRNYIENLDTARELTQEANLRGVELLYGDPSDTISQLIRTAFIAKEGYILAVADFSAIEARVLSWLAGEEWRLNVFRTTGKIYETAASMMFDVPVEKIVKGNPEYALRAKGKIAELALGYQGGRGALTAMGALKMGLEAKELDDIVDRWRKKCPEICKFWRCVEDAALEAVRTGRNTYSRKTNSNMVSLKFERVKTKNEIFLSVKLPSGRRVYYPRPRIEINKFNREAISYWTYQKGSWVNASTYGGKLVENITQAVARDCLAVSIRRLNDAGFTPLMHIHDEVVCEIPLNRAFTARQDMEEIMGTTIDWAKDLPLKAAGFISPYYMKD